MREHLTLLPALLAMGVFVVLGAEEGGFEPTTFYPSALLLLALLVVAFVALPPPRPGRAAAVAVGLLAAYAAWSWLSVAWADSTGVAVVGANRTVLFAIVFALFALWPMRGRQGAFVVGLFALGTAGVGLVEIVRVNADATPVEFFFRGRLTEPVGYANANVALWSLALVPCVVFASRREIHPLLRGLFLGSAGVLAGLALLGQSRGWFFALPLVMLALVAIVPGRSRVIVALAALGAGVLAMAGPVLEVFEAQGAGPIDGLFADATRSILPVSAALALAGAAAGFLDRRVRVGEPTARRASRGVLATTGALALAGLVVLVAATGSPVADAKDKWEEFKEGGSTTADVDGSRFTSDLATHRYDFWSVAWANFERAPVAGVGVDNFQQDYLQRGDSGESPRYPHSLELRVLSQTGLIGALLLFGSIAAAFIALAPALRRRRGLAGAAAGAASVSFIYWLLHGSVDWLWEFAGLGAPAFALLGVAVATAAPDRRPSGRPARPARLLAAAAGVALASACAFALLLPWLSERDTDRAVETWLKSPGAAFDRLDRAADLNRLSARPAIVAGTIAVTIDSLDVAEREFSEALDREPRDSYALLMLGAIASERGDGARAQDFLRRAVDAAPNNEITRDVFRSVSKGRRVDAIRVGARLSAATRARVAPVLQD